MNSITSAFLFINAVLLLFLPRHWAVLPLLLSAFCLSVDHIILIGPFHFTAIRLMLTIGFIRILVRRERISGRLNKLDNLIFIWSIWALISSIFHINISNALIFRLGLVYNVLGIYILFRFFIHSFDDIEILLKIIAFLLAMIAMEMVIEKIYSLNLFSLFGDTIRYPAIRDGRIRAQGPFAHAILAGTAGAVSIPLMFGLWQIQRSIAIIGITACILIVFTCASSGPIISLLCAIGALLLWRFKSHLSYFRWLIATGYLLLELFMEAPAYYLLARIDFTGSSTGYHRAALIESSIKHIDEWWLGGADYTRHWMPTGVSWSENHTDITNHFIHMGVLCGLPLLILFILTITTSFHYVGVFIKQQNDTTLFQSKFILWTLGSSLFTHTVTFISVSYFDQSFTLFCLTLSAISSMYNTADI